MLTPSLLVPANADDSARAAQWGVALGNYNTKAGVIMELNGRFVRAPATTFGVLPTRLIQLVAGAYQSRTAADSLLRQLHAQRTLAPAFGQVTSLPFAFIVDSAVPSQAVAARVARFVARGHPVYALRQPDGTARLYFGAYSTAEQAAIAAPSVREAGLTPTLVYRIGRVF